MIRIEKKKIETRVYFETVNAYGRKSENYISIDNCNYTSDELPCINIPATGNLFIESIPAFVKAVEIAQMIAEKTLEVK